MSEYIFCCCHNLGMGRSIATSIWYIESRDAAQHLTMHTMAPYNKELSGPKGK